MPDPFTALLEARRNEAAGRGLAKLPVDYYAATRTYLEELRRSYEADLRENPSSRKGEISRQTYQRASQVARDILEGRLQKVLTLAFQASIGGARDLPNALPEERAVFDEVLGALLRHRRSTAPYLESGPAPAAAPAPLPVVAPAAAPRPPAPAGTEYVRIVQGGHVVELEHERVELRADDVISLPPPQARLLVEAKVAEPLRVARPGPP